MEHLSAVSDCEPCIGESHSCHDLEDYQDLWFEYKPGVRKSLPRWRSSAVCKSYCHISLVICWFSLFDSSADAMSAWRGENVCILSCGGMLESKSRQFIIYFFWRQNDDIKRVKVIVPETVIVIFIGENVPGLRKKRNRPRKLFEMACSRQLTLSVV